MQAKVIIVDDNPVTVRSLTQTIDWASMGCEVIATASDGESGKELVLQLQPDILLLDIRMPQKDGLQMLEEVRSAVPDCKVIIITGYDQFQYASRAIKLSVFDYILKPIRNSVVEEVVRRALDQMQDKRARDVAVQRAARLASQTQLLSLIMNESRSGQDVCAMMREAGLYADCYFMMVVHSADERALPPTAPAEADALLERFGLRAVTLCAYDSLVIYVMLEGDGEDWREIAVDIDAMLREAIAGELNVGISALETSHHRIRQSYQQARQALWACTLRGSSAGCFYQAEETGLEDGVFAQMQQRIEKLVEHSDLTEASVCEAAQTLTELSGRHYTNLRALVSQYTMMLCRKFPCDPSAAVDREISAALFVSSEEDVCACLSRLYAALREARGEKESGQYSLMTRSVLEYIRLHAAQSLRLSDIADRFHINTNYLSLLIKRETGVTFHDHVLAAKMEIAHTMLADPRVRVAEVAHAVGYSNYVSFYNTFKRIEHMTPTEYRNKVVPNLMEEEPSDV